MRRGKPGVPIAGTRRPGRFCANCRISRDIYERTSPSRVWIGRRGPKATRKPRSRCRKPNGSYSPASNRGERHEDRRTVEMPGFGRGGKPNTGFPRAPTALGNRCAIPTFPPSRRSSGSGKPKTGFPTFHCHGLALPTKFRKEAWRRSFAPPPGSLFD